MGLRAVLKVIVVLCLLGGSAERVRASEDQKNTQNEVQNVQLAAEYLSPADRVYTSCITEGAEKAECERRARPLMEIEQRRFEQRFKQQQKRAEEVRRLRRYVKRENIRKFSAPLHYDVEHPISKLLYGSGNLEFIGKKSDEIMGS